LNVAQFVPSLELEASGPTYSVPALCTELFFQNVNIELFSTRVFENQTPAAVFDFPHESFNAISPVKLLCIAPELMKIIKNRRDEFDIVHTHSLWTMTSSFPHSLKGNGNKPVVINAPRGTLSKWALNRSKWKKRLMWLAFQKRALNRVDCFHATAEKEKNEIRQMGFKQPVAIIPNGIDLPLLDTAKQDRNRRLMFLGRVHPVKGIDILLRSWQSLMEDFPDWELMICGPGESDYAVKMKALAQSLGLHNIVFSDGVFGDEKRKMYQSADLYVLPSHTENYGMTVAESLANATPVIATSGTPWTTLAEHGCGWTIDLSLANLTNCLQAAMRLDDAKLTKMGLNGRAWMDRDFSWREIARKMTCVYQWLLGEGELPECVELFKE
jgi:glycosyltransferase involved in cell wall biosynthesis